MSKKDLKISSKKLRKILFEDKTWILSDFLNYVENRQKETLRIILEKIKENVSFQNRKTIRSLTELLLNFRNGKKTKYLKYPWIKSSVLNAVYSL